MRELKSVYDSESFEKYGDQGLYHTPEQQLEITKVEARVNSQLDWLGQLLGWRGPDHWTKLAGSVEAKRNLLTGSFGFYNGFVFPEVVEVKSWENKIITRASIPLNDVQAIFIGDIELELLSILQIGENLEITFSELSTEALTTLSEGGQLRAIVPSEIPNPFLRPEVGVSGDREFIVILSEGGTLTLYPGEDVELKTPHLFNTFYQGSRYWFDKPLKLLADGLEVLPKYDFQRGRWWFDVPLESSVEGIPLEGSLTSLEGNDTPVRLKRWKDPSDWLSKEIIENFKGVWGDKGGKLPLHFTFDALSLHGFNEKLSVRLDNVTRDIPFDELLEYVYIQRVPISPAPPNYRANQVWWNSETGTFSIYVNGALNCGPWVEIQYPDAPSIGPLRDFVFPDVESFTSYSGEIPGGSLVDIIDMAGLGPEASVKGLVDTLSGPGRILLTKIEEGNSWEVAEIILQSVSSFVANCQEIPSNCVVKLVDSSGLSPEGPGNSYKILNLSFSIEDGQTILLMKDRGGQEWFISPPSNLKYIGNTRMFREGPDSSPLEGEMNWDFSNPDPNSRGARIFYYSRLVEDEELGWRLEGDWVSVKDETAIVPGFDVETIEFGAVKVYCNENLLSSGTPFRENDYQFSYSVDEETGKFTFSFIPVNYEGSINLPKVEISDSLTGVFRFDISHLVFSGLAYRITPNVEDSETLLRVWKNNSLQVSDSSGDLEASQYLNALRADVNSGPSDPNWSRFHIRLPPSYGRDGVSWQKVSQICQNLCYWGTPVIRENMGCPPPKQEPQIYEKVCMEREPIEKVTLLYSEPYFFSDVDFSFHGGEDYDNSDVVPGLDQPFDDFIEADLRDYSPLNERGVDLTSPVGAGFGEWDGIYVLPGECVELTGHFANDIIEEVVTPVFPPIWDSSVYKLPPHCKVGDNSGRVDSNNFTVGYAFFTADLSAAGEPVFEFSGSV